MKSLPKNLDASLRPFAMLLAGIGEGLTELDTDELELLSLACEQAAETNCWCYTYQAAKYIQPEVERLLRERRATA